MFLKDFLVTMLSNLTTLPAALLCLAPMKDRMRFAGWKTFLQMFIVLVLVSAVGSFLQVKFFLEGNTVLLPSLIILFFVYRNTLFESASKALAVFVYVCSLMAIFANAANALDALVNPEAGALHLTTANAFFQFAISSIGAGLLYFPMRRYGSRLVNNLDDKRIWHVTTIISSIFLIACVLIVPQKYETLYTNRVFLAFLVVQGTFFLLQLLLAIIFYNIVKWMQAAARDREKARLLEMQESNYIRQQEYIDRTARARHDLKQTIRTLNGMATENDLEAIKKYLAKYVESMPENDVMQYCSDAAINALLNHYAQTAVQNGIDITLQVNLPGRESEMDEIELCTAIGNILDNAIRACGEMEEGQRRYIRLSLTLQNETNLYIVAVNSFNGKVRKRNGMYLSTRRRGSGIGLSSVRSIAVQHGGTARFYHEDGEFFSDVMIPLAVREKSKSTFSKHKK
ncbi:MAG: sensor histidine kinase [Lachnospiraceae bacterium]|nr:sensor histidine kinase [Lachnospiraceae bacterium]